MKIAEGQLNRVVDILRSMGAKRILLFGSYASSPETAQDIDLAVEGIPLRRLLDADAAVFEALEAPFDLVSREENPRFFDIISEDAKALYEYAQTGA
ncbi:MAG: nucleotidyltransferase domain-containing protein [Candidatus Sumerlaeota bacterium]|nr:nucleotidyltransferase domain-containing protein [Candidatus Sumerlaeota bacterium]